MKEYSGQKICEKIFEYTELKNLKILEIGCGTGRISSILSTKTNLLVAIDPDENAIKKARANVSGIDFRIGSGEALDFPAAFFDIVIFTLSLHHQDSQKALNEATRVLKTGGKILVIEPIPEGEIEIIFSFLHNENKEKYFAQNCIDMSGLKIGKSEVFTSDWVFENKIDLFNSVFEYYDMPFDYDTTKEISNFLGEKINSDPIVCEDKMIIQILEVET